MNFEEIRDRKLKIITTQRINADGSYSSIQSEAFNAATKAIIIRQRGASSNIAVNFEIGVNPTASELDFYIQGQEILTFNVEPGHKIAVQGIGSDVKLHIIELGY
jgi:hypothetical protein